MQKDLDLTTAQMAREKYDVERLKRKSIQDENNSKRQVVHGELYAGSLVNKTTLKKVGLVVAGCLMIIVTAKTMSHFETLDTYNRVLNKTAQEELSFSDSLDFLDSYDVSNSEKYENYVEALESLDDADYTFFGDRKDGTHNDTFKADPEGGLTDKQKDAIDKAVHEELEEYVRGK